MVSSIGNIQQFDRNDGPRLPPELKGLVTTAAGIAHSYTTTGGLSPDEATIRALDAASAMTGQTSSVQMERDKTVATTVADAAEAASQDHASTLEAAAKLGAVVHGANAAMQQNATTGTEVAEGPSKPRGGREI